MYSLGSDAHKANNTRDLFFNGKVERVSAEEYSHFLDLTLGARRLSRNLVPFSSKIWKPRLPFWKLTKKADLQKTYTNGSCVQHRFQCVLVYGVNTENSGQFGVELVKAYDMEAEQPVLDSQPCQSLTMSCRLQ